MRRVIAPATWRAELDGYRAFQRATGKPDSSIKLRDYHLRSFAVAVGKPPFEVTLSDMLEHLAHEGWSSNTRRAVRTTLASFYRWADDVDRTPTNLAAKLPGVTFAPGKPRPASDAAVKAALMRGDARVRLMIRLGAYAGLRCCEIAKVSTDDLVQARGGWTLRVKGKGSRTRFVPIDNTLATEIREAGPGYAFPGQIDGHLSAGYVSKIVSDALPEGETAHKLRHRFGTLAYRGSHDLRAVQELLGHSSVATTQIYTAVDDDDLRRAASAAA